MMGSTLPMIVTMYFIVLVILVVNIGVGAWVFQDARKRDLNPWLWMVVTLSAGGVGLVVYLVIGRPQGQLSEKGEGYHGPRS